MLGSDAMGRKVSLLNDAGVPLPKSSPSQHLPSRSRGLARSNHKIGDDYQSKSRTSYAASRKYSCSSRMSVCSQSSSSDSNSRASNYNSRTGSPASRTTTPQLLRNDSTSSDQSQRSLHTPSPMTPTYSFDPLDPNKQNPANPNEPFYRSNGPYFATMQQAVNAAPAQPQQYYPMTATNPLGLDDTYQLPQQPFPAAPPNVQFAYPAELIQPTSPISLASPASSVAPASAASQTAASTAGSAAGSKPAKKKYPCPHAARYSCTDTFTTSGHAARHGKKHTGEKNIHCPVCNKAFTRKDNMKQHERTHRPERNPAAPSAPSDPAKQQAGGPSAPALATEPVADAAADHDDDDDEDDDDDDDSSSDQRATNSAAPRKKVCPSTTTDEGAAASLFDTIDTQLRAYGGVLDDCGHDAVPPATIDGSTKKRKGKEVAASALPARPNVGRTTSGDSAMTEDGEGESPGLDALAMAASGFGR